MRLFKIDIELINSEEEELFGAESADTVCGIGYIDFDKVTHIYESKDGGVIVYFGENSIWAKNISVNEMALQICAYEPYKEDYTENDIEKLIKGDT